MSVTDGEALEGLRELCRLEGILPALESAHAVVIIPAGQEMGPEAVIVVNLSGRGDKDVEEVARHLAERLGGRPRRSCKVMNRFDHMFASLRAAAGRLDALRDGRGPDPFCDGELSASDG